MTTPSIVPSKYLGTDLDYLHAPRQDNGSMQLVVGSVSVPALTVPDAIIGLIPFQKGACFHITNGSIHSADLDTSTNVTMDIGIVYDDNVTYTDDLDAFVSASTAPQAGGFLTVDEKEGLTLITSANGWLVAQVNAATTTTGSISFNVGVQYGNVA